MNPSPAIPSPSSSSSASVPMVVITVVGIFAAFALLASYYAFVTKCQLLRGVLWRNPPWRGGHYGPRGRDREVPSVIRAVATEDRRGLGLPLIRMLPVVKFTAAAPGGAEEGGAGMAARISVSECAVCLSEFVERERVRLLPNCSHAFHIDCIDTWLQGSARCPFCRSDVTLPPALVHAPAVRPTSTTAPSYRASCGDDDVGVERRRHRDELFTTNDSVVTELRGEHKSWVSQGQPAGRRLRKQQQRKVVESVGDEAIDTRKKDLEFSVQPIRRSLSMDSSCDKQLYVSVVQEFLTQRQV